MYVTYVIVFRSKCLKCMVFGLVELLFLTFCITCFRAISRNSDL